MRNGIYVVLFLALLIVAVPRTASAVPSGATKTPLISIELYWAFTAGGFGDLPQESEWHVIYGDLLILNPTDKGAFLYLKTNGTVLMSFDHYIEVSIVVGYGWSNGTIPYTTFGVQTDYWDMYKNNVTVTICVNTTAGEYYYNRRTIQVDFGQRPTTTSTIQQTTTSSQITSPDTSASSSQTDTLPENSLSIISSLAPILVICAVAVGAVLVTSKRRPMRVLVLCPYCGAKVEQGIMICPNCGGKI